MGTRERDRERDKDRELLIPVTTIFDDEASKSSSSPPTPTISSTSHGREVLAFLSSTCICMQLQWLRHHDLFRFHLDPIYARLQQVWDLNPIFYDPFTQNIDNIVRTRGLVRTWHLGLKLEPIIYSSFMKILWSFDYLWNSLSKSDNKSLLQLLVCEYGFNFVLHSGI